MKPKIRNRSNMGFTIPVLGLIGTLFAGSASATPIQLSASELGSELLYGHSFTDSVSGNGVSAGISFTNITDDILRIDTVERWQINPEDVGYSDITNDNFGSVRAAALAQYGATWGYVYWWYGWFYPNPSPKNWEPGPLVDDFGGFLLNPGESFQWDFVALNGLYGGSARDPNDIGELVVPVNVIGEIIPATVPEPGPLALIAFGLLGTYFVRRQNGMAGLA